MRTSLELFEELEREAKAFSEIALALGFYDHTEFLWYSDGHKSEIVYKLKKLIEEGGEPFGVGVHIVEDIGSFYLRQLLEYETDEVTLTYLKKIQGIVAGALSAKGRLLGNLDYSEGWIR